MLIRWKNFMEDSSYANSVLSCLSDLEMLGRVINFIIFKVIDSYLFILIGRHEPSM